MTEQTETTTGTNVVSFTDEAGNVVTRDFGKKGLIQKEVTISEEAIDVKLFLVTGVQKAFSFLKTNLLYDTMAARGVIEFIGNSIAGVYSDKEGTHPEDFNLGIEQAISALLAGVIPTREKADKAAKGLGDLIRAYTELRAEAKDGEGNPRFTAEESSYDAVKALILGSTEEENKVRMGRANVKAKIEAYKAERAIARAKAAGAQVAVADDADLV
jgi:hypothetical protein